MIHAVLLCLLVQVADEPTITVPVEVRHDVGKIAVVTAVTPGKVVRWIPLDEGLDILDAAFLRDKTFAASSSKPGRFRVLALAAIEGTPIYAQTVLVFEGMVPPPPPLPPPVPDALAARLKAAYELDTSPAKRGQLVALTGIYEAMADHAADKKLKTIKDLADVLAKVRSGIMQPGVLLEMRRILDSELSAAFGMPDQRPLDHEQAVAFFRRVLAAMPRAE